MVMPRYRRALALRPVNRLKHIVDISQTLAANTLLGLNVIDTKDQPVLANVSEVQTGCTINGVYLNIEVASNDAIVTGAIPNFYFIIFKNPGGNIATLDPTGTGDSDDKRFIIHQEMKMIENKGQGSNPRVIFNGVIAIPKGYRRFGPNDALQIAIKCPAIATVSCLQMIFKEFR